MMMSTFIHLKIQTVELPSSVRYYAGTDLLIYLGQFAQKGPFFFRARNWLEKIVLLVGVILLCSDAISVSRDLRRLRNKATHYSPSLMRSVRPDSISNSCLMTRRNHTALVTIGSIVLVSASCVSLGPSSFMLQFSFLKGLLLNFPSLYMSANEQVSTLKDLSHN